ncbi:PREDICTED: carbohydrate sulfotransferase 10 isoform X5 [Cercocebus atys]|uniref:carbohydrate sulfotransferase 10 isoform X5 n=1 Tax=Cercocebus atys TaxID=9531 RepID=UPI0005F50CA9|nr:PREDICTED: carbohydrate sulfotransferase 10 isoform X5 [Cercocebus atys]
MIDVAAEASKMLRNRATARGGGWSGVGGSSPAIQECPRDTPGEQGGVSSKGTSTHRGQGASEQLLCVLVHLPVPPPTHAHTRPLTLQPTGKELPDSRLVQPLVYMERLELIRNVCRDDALKNLSHTPVSKFVLDRIFVCDKHRILFCQTPKVGNTQWKKVLIVLNGAFPSIEEIPENVVHDHEKNGLPRLSSFSDAEIQKRLKTYFKFFIVRDPFERLISAFKDKFVHNPRFEPWYRHEIAPGIIRKYRRNRTETRGIQFEDFVRYLGDPNHRWLDLQFGDHIIHWGREDLRFAV